MFRSLYPCMILSSTSRVVTFALYLIFDLFYWTISCLTFVWLFCRYFSSFSNNIMISWFACTLETKGLYRCVVSYILIHEASFFHKPEIPLFKIRMLDHQWLDFVYFRIACLTGNTGHRQYILGAVCPRIYWLIVGL